MKVEAVIVTYNSGQHVGPCLTSLQGAGIRIVAVDNDSRDDTLNIVRNWFPDVRLIATEKNLGYGKALNLGVSQTTSPLLLLANADTVFPANSIEALAAFVVARPKVGVAGPQEVFPDGSWQRSHGEIPGLAEGLETLLGITSIADAVDRLRCRYLPSSRAERVGYVDGAVMMIRRSAFDEIGGFDVDFPYYCEDADFCLRMRGAGWGVVSVPSIRVTHVRGGSSTKVEGYSDRLLLALATARYHFIKKHCPHWHWPLYRTLSVLHAKKMSLIYRQLEFLRSGSDSLRASVMAEAFTRWGRVLRRMET